MAASALSKIERAHQMYREGNHGEALGLYTEALAMAKTKAQKIALHSNRAACFLKLHHFNKAAEECTSVLELDHQHTGALMLRAQTLVTLKEYQSALFDVNRLIELKPSSDVYQNLQSRLKTQLSLAPIPESEEESLDLEEEGGGGGGEEEGTTLTGEHKGEDPNMSPKAPVTLTQNLEAPPDVLPKGWGAIPKPSGHSALDYSRWDRVENDSSEEEDDEEEEQQPQYRFRVRTVGVRPVK
ncbi:protein unc-45-like protein A [Iris pallida]|uniref:Protein unc-45-like protein A n=1 Tax=Iris pallida TaxID=29817 RepID=A0AAX6GYV8_IRIPA|nr:protein unc-45-like protein A [Iris pallida]KAJ6833498.1 protein unc-45-like protein A [Iris pallida]